MSIAVILNTHENSHVLHDTLDSVSHYLTKDVLVVVDGLAWDQFKNAEIPALKMSGFPHGKNFAPFRNVALGLFKSWQTWGESKQWYCYLEYDCVVGSGEVIKHLQKADEFGFWLLGNDLRQQQREIPFLEKFINSKIKTSYLLGSCLFFSSKFMRALSDDNFFERFLSFSNFYDRDIYLIEDNQKEIIDISEFLYPTLANYYGGEIRELACWKEESSTWTTENSEFYPMRFKPDITLNDPYMQACILHPLKSFDNPVRQYHRGKRHGRVLTKL